MELLADCGAQATNMADAASVTITNNHGPLRNFRLTHIMPVSLARKCNLTFYSIFTNVANEETRIWHSLQLWSSDKNPGDLVRVQHAPLPARQEIGRASCRERVARPVAH